MKTAVSLACAAAMLSCAPAVDAADPGSWREVPAVPGRGVSLVGDWRAANGEVLRVSEPDPGRLVGTLVHGVHSCYRAGDEVMRATSDRMIPSRWHARWWVAWSAAGRPSLPFQPASGGCARTSFEAIDAGYGLSAGGLAVCGVPVGLRDALEPVAAVQRYRIEYKAWIPHEDIMDPVAPLTFSWPPLYTQFVPERLESCFAGAARVSTAFIGDGHAGYGASGGGRADFRVLLWAEFDWDGRRISGFRDSHAAGPSHRLVRTPGARSSECRQTAVARQFGAVAQVGDDGVRLRIEAKVPLTPAATTPAIDGEIIARFGPDGLHVGATTDGFPSHGFAVLVGGRPVIRTIVNDVRCVGAHGVAAAGNLSRRLTTLSAHGNRPASLWTDSPCSTEGDLAPAPTGWLSPLARPAFDLYTHESLAAGLVAGLRYAEAI